MSGGREKLSTTSDEQLACDARAGCVASFEELARRMQVPLVRFLSRRFPSRQDAEDVTQEALLKAYQALGTYKVGPPFRTWVFTIAYRVAVSRGRGERGGKVMSCEAAGGEDPAAVVERRDTGEHLWRVARDVLGEEAVTVLWLYYVEGLSAGEIGRVTGRSWVGVKTTLHRARRRLAPHLLEQPVGRVVKVGGVL